MISNVHLIERRERILEVATRHGAKNVRVFGSLARGESTEASDLDLLVDFDQGRSLFDQVHLIQELEEMLGYRVHVVEPEGLHWFIRDRVLEEAVLL